MGSSKLSWPTNETQERSGGKITAVIKKYQ